MLSHTLLLYLLLLVPSDLASVCADASMCGFRRASTSRRQGATKAILPSHPTKALVPGEQQEVAATSAHIQPCVPYICIYLFSMTEGNNHEIKHAAFPQSGRIELQSIRESYLENLGGYQPPVFSGKDHSVCRGQNNLVSLWNL